MEVLIAIGCGIIGILVLSVILLLPLRIRFARELRQKTQLELEKSVFRYEDDYFGYIGPEHPDVVAFKKLIEEKNIDGIRERWKSLSSSFVKLERKVGHRGRPLIMDYYNWYEMEFRELRRRGT